MSSYSSKDIAALFGAAKSVADCDAVAWRLVKDGHVPDAIASSFWKWVTIEESGHTLEVLFAPCYFALGDDDDPWFVDRVSEVLAQNVADKFGAILPTWKLLQAAQKQSDPKIPYVDVKAHGVDVKEIESHKASLVANEYARKAYDDHGIGIGDHLVLTWAKSYLTHPNDDGSHICIGGGSWDSSGTNYVQPPCSPHVMSYADASQRIALVSRKCKLDGDDADLRDDVALSKDPKIWGLVCGPTKFDPVVPNVGTAGGKMSYAIDPVTGQPLGGKVIVDGQDRTTAIYAATGAILGLGGTVALGLSAVPAVLGAAAGGLIGRYVGQKRAKAA